MPTDLIEAAQAKVPSDRYAEVLETTNGRIDEILVNQKATWIEERKHFDPDKEDTGWWAWLEDLRARGEKEVNFERPLYHLLLAVFGHLPEVVWSPANGGGAARGGRKQLQPFLTKGIIRGGDVDFYGASSSTDCGGCLGWELKASVRDNDNWQAIVQCDSLMGLDRKVGCHVLTDLKHWRYLQLTRDDADDKLVSRGVLLFGCLCCVSDVSCL